MDGGRAPHSQDSTEIQRDSQPSSPPAKPSPSQYYGGSLGSQVALSPGLAESELLPRGPRQAAEGSEASERGPRGGGSGGVKGVKVGKRIGK